MKAWLVVSSYLPNPGGLQTVTAQLAIELQKRGVNVSVLTQRYPRTLAESERIDGVQVQRLFFLTPRLRDLLRGRIALFLAGLIFFPLTLVRLLWKIARAKPDVVNLHFVGAPAFFLLIARTLIPFRFIVSLHGDDVEGLPRGTALDRWVFRATLRRADAVTSCSRYLLDRAIACEPAIARRARVIHNGIDLNFPFPLGEGDQGDKFLCVGRMVPKKGFDILLRALSQCHHAGHPLRLRLIGDGPERCALENLARDLGLHEWIEFRGSQKHDEIIRAMASSRAVIIPSRQEPFGLVALEAMAVGKPVIAARVGGLPEVLADADAILVPPDDPAALAHAIDDLTARLERDPAFGARNRAIAARFSVARMTDAYLSIYRAES
jgi:glycosyltransferase involved in cell wall biosynthesis